MTLLERLPHTVSHYRRAYTQDEYGASLPSLTLLTSDVRAWVQNANHSEVTEFQKDDQYITHKVYYASDPGIRPGDVITVTAGPSFVGKQLNYQSSTDRSAGLGILFTAMCDEENNEPASFSG